MKRNLLTRKHNFLQRSNSPAAGCSWLRLLSVRTHARKNTARLRDSHQFSPVIESTRVAWRGHVVETPNQATVTQTLRWISLISAIPASRDVSLAGPPSPSLLPDLTFPPETFLQRHSNLPRRVRVRRPLRAPSPGSAYRSAKPFFGRTSTSASGACSLRRRKLSHQNGESSQITKPPRTWSETEAPLMSENGQMNESKSSSCKII